MKNLIWVKQGEMRPNLFYDACQYVNNMGLVQDHAQQAVSFYRRTDYTLQLINDDLGLAAVQFNYTSSDKGVPGKYCPIDIPLILSALDTHTFVLVGTILNTGCSMTPDQLLSNVGYYSRDPELNLIDLRSGLIVGEPNSQGIRTYKGMVSLLGCVKAGAFPLYYFIQDSGIIGSSHLVDFEVGDTHVTPIREYDGTLSARLMSFVLTGATQVGQSLFIKDSAQLEFLPLVVTSHLDPMTSIPGGAELAGDCPSSLENNVVTLTPTAPVSVFSIKFPLGPFFESVQPCEKPELNFIVYKVS